MKVQIEKQEESQKIFENLQPGTAFFDSGKILIVTDWERMAIDLSSGELVKVGANDIVTLIEPVAISDGIIIFAEK